MTIDDFSYHFINVGVVCEGQTEVNFIKSKLNREYFIPRQISLKPISIDEVKNSLGGNVSVERIIYYIKRANYPIVTTLIDYYGIKYKGNKTAEEIEKEICNIKNYNNIIIPYLQVHELEALLFSDIDSIIKIKKANDAQIKNLKEIQKKYKNPEDINDSPQTAPSKRLEQIFDDYGKIVDSNLIFDEIPINIIKQKCPRFGKWLDNIDKACTYIRNRKS